MMRILTTHAGELKHFAAGDLGGRIGGMYNNLKMLLNMFLSILLTAACALLCFFQMFVFAPGPAGIAAVITAVLIILYGVVLFRQSVISADRMRFQAEESGLTYSLIDGMTKITLSGAEKRAFSVWANVYRKSIRTLYNPPLLLKISGMLTPVIMLAGTMLLYLAALSTHVPQADFYAFLSSYGILTTALTMISTSSSRFADAIPVFRMMEPLMRCNPENDGEKEVVKDLKGNISLQNITFGYVDHMPPVLDNLNMEIREGEYVAIVGATGSGKSTIVRLMLGFETPDHGDVYYDGKNIKSLDLTSLRRKIGTVLQNGGVFQGTIYSNITIAGTGLTEEDAWEAARIAGIAEDIDRMRIHQKGMNLSVFLTNGTLLTPEFLSLIKRYNPDAWITISFDGIGFHDWLRQRKGCEEEAVHAIRMCREAGLRVYINTNVNRKNVHVMFDSFRMLSDLGIDKLRIIRTSESPRWVINRQDYMLSVDEYYDFSIGFARRYKESGSPVPVIIWQSLFLNGARKSFSCLPVKQVRDCVDDAYLCSSMMAKLSVQADGEMVPCAPLGGYYASQGIHHGNIHEKSLQELLTEGPLIDVITSTVSDKLKKNKTCAECPHVKYCQGGCPALALVNNGSMYNPDPSKCAYFNQGYYGKYCEALEGWRNLQPLESMSFNRFVNLDIRGSF